MKTTNDKCKDIFDIKPNDTRPYPIRYQSINARFVGRRYTTGPTITIKKAHF